MSRPESTTVIGLPGPGASSVAAPIAARHHSVGTSGSVAAAERAVLGSRRSGSATPTTPARRRRATPAASTRQIRSSGTSSVPPARRASAFPLPCLSWTSSARPGAALASRTAVTMIRRRAKVLSLNGDYPGGDDSCVCRSRLEPRRPRGDAESRRRAAAECPGDEGAAALDAPQHRTRRRRRPASLPERRRRARDRAVGARAARRAARAGAGLRAKQGGRRAAGAAYARPRSPALRGGRDRRARARGPASEAARAPLRAGAARRPEPCPGSPWKGVGGDLAREARLIRAMSHLDELDEFEAELELRLKKEYTAVFGLFRYCVLTQDATYLCNRLDLAQVSQPNYPFFHLRLEAVWVWDKNRPTRIIPRAEVWTSSDVTVEELRGEGEDSHLTAESLAEKIGESLSADDDL